MLEELDPIIDFNFEDDDLLGEEEQQLILQTQRISMAGELDKNGDSLLSLEELNWLLERIGVYFSLKELESLVRKRSLDFNEFVFFWESISKSDSINGSHHPNDENDDDQKDADLVKAFNVFDLNGDGFISCEELQSILSRLGLWDEKSGKDCRTMICMYDTNSDGVLDFEECKNMMLHTIS